MLIALFAAGITYYHIISEDLEASCSVK